MKCWKSRRWSRSRIALLPLLVAAIVAVTAAPSDGASPKRAADQTLVVRYIPAATGSPVTLDPAFLENNNDTTAVSNLFETLVKVDAKGRVLPGIATSWKQNGATWTFTLRRNAKFSDGSPITSADVKYSLVRTLTPVSAADMKALGVTTATPHGFTVLPDVLGAADVAAGKATAIAPNAVTAPSKYTVKVTLAKPRADLLLRLAYASEGIVKASNVQASTGKPWWYQPVSSGPFKVAAFVPGTSLSLVPNPRYYGPKPILKHVEFKVVADTQTAEIAYEAKNLDVVKTTYSEVLPLETHGYKDQLRSALDSNVSVFIVNAKVAPTDDPHVARAIAMAIDRRTLAKQVLDNLVTPAYTFTPQYFPGYSAKGFKPLAFNPAAAKAELAKSKYGSNITVRAWSSGSQDPRAIQALAQMLQQNLGIKVQIENALSPAQAPESQGANLILSGQGPTFVAPCSMMQRWPDFVAFADGAKNVNFGAFNPAPLDSMMASCYAASGANTWKRVVALEQLMTDYPQFIPVNYNRSYYLVQPYVKNIAFGQIWNISNLSQVWIAAH